VTIEAAKAINEDEAQPAVTLTSKSIEQVLEKMEMRKDSF